MMSNEKLSAKFGGNDCVKKSMLNALRWEFEVLEMTDTKTITEYFARVMAVANKMRSNGENMPNSKVVEKILRTLTTRFTYVVVSIEESQDIEAMSIDELQSSLVVIEQKFKRVSRDDKQVLTLESSRGRGRGRGRGSYRGRGRGRGRQSFSKATMECFKCHNLELDEIEELLLMATVDTRANRNVTWFLDSGCSNHMCGDKGVFVKMVSEAKHFVKCGNNSRMTVVGTGSVKLVFNDTAFLIQNVYYVPKLHKNLLSMGQLQEKGLSILIRNGKCNIYHLSKGLIAHTNMSTNHMFILFNESFIIPTPTKECLLTSSDLTYLWHQRFCHLSYKGLKTLQTRKMVHGLLKLDSSSIVCGDYFTGKQHRNPIPKASEWRASTILELIHANICGPIELISNSGKSCKGWVYFLSEKFEALECFKSYKKMVEKEVKAFIKYLQTDRGGEFNSLVFKLFCEENGIKRKLTTAYTPHQNGVAECKNRIVMNKVRCMLSIKGVPKSFWTEPVNWTFYLLNYCPTHIVKNITPKEAWSGIKPSIKHLRVWECLAHVHIPEAKRELDWGSNYKEQIENELVWGDDENNENDEFHSDSENNEGSVVRNEAVSSQEHVIQGRERRKPTGIGDFVSGEGLSEEEEAKAYMVQDVTGDDPILFEEVVKHEKWRKAMDNEINSIEKNQTWELMDLPTGAKTTGVKWIYKTKLNELGEVDKYKARLVAKGYSQQHGIDFSEVFAHVARMDTVRLIVALAACKECDIFQLDVKSAFLHGELSENVYVEQPKGYVKKGKEHKVYKLHKALYGLRQAPRAWFNRIEAHFM
ncbi:hypothetical protein CR513_45924, partial [Mucuna pruriens]